MKTTKFLTLTILGWLCSLSLWAYDFEVGGLYYTLTSLENLEVEVSKGNWGDWNDANEKYKGNIVIPNTVIYNGRDLKVIGIETEAFLLCTGLNSIDFGNVQTIGNKAFYGCTGLTAIDFGNVQTIGNNAFQGCNSLTTIDFKNVRTIGNNAFNSCVSLTLNDLGKVQTIGDDAFVDCIKLVSLNLKDVKTIGKSTFERCTNLKSLDFGSVKIIPDGDKKYDAENKNYIVNGICYGCQKLEMVTLRNVQHIGSEAFRDCVSLNSLDFSNVETIGDDAFYGCTGLTTIDFRNVQSIGNGTFERCSNLKSIDFKNIKSIGEASFYRCSSLISVDLKNIISVGAYPFGHCTNLISIDFGKVSVIPDDESHEGATTRYKPFCARCKNLKSINLRNVQKIGAFSFKDCEKLEQVKTSQKNPPEVLRDAFHKLAYLATLEVPVGCKNAYQDSKEWKKFYEIVETSEDLPSVITDLSVQDISVKGFDSHIVVEGAHEGDRIMVYTAEGAIIASEISNGLSCQIRVEPHHVYIVKVGTRTFKVGL